MTNGSAIMYLFASFFGIVVSLIVLYIRQIGKSIDRLHAGQDSLRAEMKAGQESLRAEMKAGQESLRAEMKAGQESLRAEISGLSERVGKLETHVAVLTDRISWLRPFAALIAGPVLGGEHALEPAPSSSAPVPGGGQSAA